MKEKKHSHIIMIIIVMIIIILAIAIYYKYSNSTITSKTDENVSYVEINNGYKTFNFTIDEILKAYAIAPKDTISNSEAPYCEEHKETDCLILPIDTQYMDMSVVYEQKTRKVISIDMIQSLEKQKYFLAGVDKSDTFEKSYNYLLEKTGNVFDILGKGTKIREKSLENQVLETKNFISIIEESELKKLEEGENLDVNKFKGRKVGIYQLTRR